MNPFKRVVFATIPWNRLVLLAPLGPFAAAARVVDADGPLAGTPTGLHLPTEHQLGASWSRYK
jgi:hypothetical protein